MVCIKRMNRKALQNLFSVGAASCKQNMNMFPKDMKENKPYLIDAVMS